MSADLPAAVYNGGPDPVAVVLAVGVLVCVVGLWLLVGLQRGWPRWVSVVVAGLVAGLVGAGFVVGGLLS